MRWQVANVLFFYICYFHTASEGERMQNRKKTKSKKWMTGLLEEATAQAQGCCCMPQCAKAADRDLRFKNNVTGVNGTR